MPVVRSRIAATVLVGVGLLAAVACRAEEDPLASIATPQSTTAAPNGVDQLAPREALEATIDALQDKGSFHVSGTTIEGSAIDIKYQIGRGATGTIDNAGQGRSPVRLLAADDRIYVTGDKRFLAEAVGKDAASTIGGKWLRLADDSANQYEVFADGKRFAQAVLGSRASEIEMTGVQPVDGRSAVGLVFAETGATLWVAASGEPLPLRLEEKGASAGTGVLNFSDIGAKVSVKPPDPKSVVDAEGLPGSQQ